ncbi:putative histone acetyltransferase, partial [Plasmodium gaboni]
KLKVKKKRSLNIELPSDEYKDELERNSLIVKKKLKKEKLSLMKEFNLEGDIKRKEINIKTNDNLEIKKKKENKKKSSAQLML